MVTKLCWNKSYQLNPQMASPSRQMFRVLPPLNRWKYHILLPILDHTSPLLPFGMNWNLHDPTSHQSSLRDKGREGLRETTMELEPHDNITYICFLFRTTDLIENITKISQNLLLSISSTYGSHDCWSDVQVLWYFSVQFESSLPMYFLITLANF
jgi:hypothetical protein